MGIRVSEEGIVTSTLGSLQILTVEERASRHRTEGTKEERRKVRRGEVGGRGGKRRREGGRYEGKWREGIGRM